MKKEIDMKDFAENYSQAYQTFYGSDDSVLNCIEFYFCRMFDERYNSDEQFTDIANKFIEYRQDMMTSDRECAAFTVTYMAFNREF